MSQLPIMIDGSRIEALVVGGGSVAERKVRALLASDVRVRVVARAISAPLRALAGETLRLTATTSEYHVEQIGDAMLVVAATDDGAVNARIAADATARHRLVNVADRAESGSFIMPAVHRAGDLTVAVSAGVPGAARRVRDAIANRFDARYASVIGDLRSLRERLLNAGDRSAWTEASADLLDEKFCSAVEDGALARRISAWR